jgi:hypothetical protein
VTVVSLPPVVGAERRLRAVPRVRVAGQVRAVAAATAACVLAGALFVHLDARADLRAERATLTDARLEQAVAAAKEALASAGDRLAQVRGDLLDRTAQRDELRAELQAATSELEGVRTNLVARFTQLGLQGQQITSLDSCLNGVSRALLQLAFEDDAGAARSLEQVADPCSAASVALR